jgi:hypothetical protein
MWRFLQLCTHYAPTGKYLLSFDMPTPQRPQSAQTVSKLKITDAGGNNQRIIG